MFENISFKTLRHKMVEEQLKRRGIMDKNVLDVMETIPREVFVPELEKKYAYDDHPLPIGCNQTISQPYMVAIMTELLKLSGHEKILEIGTGSGYQTAVLSKLAKEVFTIDRIPELVEKAKLTLKALNITNVQFKYDDGTLGWPEFSPYDRILVTAGAPHIPGPLIHQLKINGQILIPVGDSFMQTLKIITKIKNGIEETNSIGCIFVPLIGKHGWKQ